VQDLATSKAGLVIRMPAKTGPWVNVLVVHDMTKRAGDCRNAWGIQIFWEETNDWRLDVGQQTNTPTD
jgi:hypothetical protein